MIRLRQVAWVAADLEAGTADVVDRLGLDVCFVDPGVATFGLENRLFCVGDQFLEIVSPVEGGTTAGRLLEKRGAAACGYMVIFQTDADLETVRSAASELDVRIVFEAPGGDAADGTAIHGIHFHPADVGGAIVSIDRSEVAAEWAWAGPSWRNHVRTDVVSAITGLTIETASPLETAGRWGQLIGVVPDGSSVQVDDATITFVEGNGGLVAIAFTGPAQAPAQLLGTEVTISG